MVLGRVNGVSFAGVSDLNLWNDEMSRFSRMNLILSSLYSVLDKQNVKKVDCEVAAGFTKKL